MRARATATSTPSPPLGALKWKFTVPTPADPTLANVIACSPSLGADGTVYFKAEDNWLYAVTSAGALKWKSTVPGDSYAAPSVGSDGSIYIGSDSGVFYAFTSTGAPKWTMTADSGIYSSAAIDAGGNLYFASLGGTVYSLNAAGNVRWTYHAPNSISSSPALGANGLVYLGCYDGQLYALNAGTGALAWTYATGAQIRASTPAIDANGVVYVGSYDRNVYAISATGALIRTYPTDDAVRSSPAIAGNNLYFGSNDHRVYAFALGTGLAGTPWPMYQVNARRLGRAAGLGALRPSRRPPSDAPSEDGRPARDPCRHRAPGRGHRRAARPRGADPAPGRRQWRHRPR